MTDRKTEGEIFKQSKDVAREIKNQDWHPFSYKINKGWGGLSVNWRKGITASEVSSPTTGQ